MQPRTGRVLVKPSPPPVHEHYCPSQRGYGFCEDGERIPTTYSPPRFEPRWWAWNHPCRREATPSLPIDTLHDWLATMFDAGLLDNVGCAGFVGFIPALKHGAFSSKFRNRCLSGRTRRGVGIHLHRARPRRVVRHVSATHTCATELGIRSRLDDPVRARWSRGMARLATGRAVPPTTFGSRSAYSWYTSSSTWGGRPSSSVCRRSDGGWP